MLKALKWFFGLFSVYVHPFEKKVDKFFVSIKSTDNIYSIRVALLKLMRKNLMIVNVWMEKKYKGYEYLSKKVRKQMYLDAEKIVAKLHEFTALNPVDPAKMRRALDSKGLKYTSDIEDRLKWLYSIMKFLQPGKYYHYIKTASFGKLLRDPDKEKLEGDCNQIVTLYIYLYSLKFDINDLEIKLLPGHVCLHFKGIDIEATTAIFEKYTESKTVLPITEILSTNLLDLSDFREDLQKISERDLLKSAQLAYAISSLKQLVTKNLKIAYRNLSVSFLNSNNFESAIFYLKKLGDKKLLLNAYANAAKYYLSTENFKKAEFFADKSGIESLKKSVKYNIGVNFYNRKKYDKALKIFKDLRDKKMIKACYAQQFNRVSARVRNVKTLSEAKKHKSDYKRMLKLARKMKDSSLERSIRDTLNRL
ncbi:hypothetical protein GF354_03500 [Candidatus Peregrinibacteria bacterium]|nr:hypothetical protein [Candidatus Peregrinibacteria bacterium]